jgi:repressor LexA
MVNKKFTKLSERQRNILRFMQKYINQTGYPPTIREIGEATGINSTSVVNYNLNKLVEAGYMERSDKVSRGLRLKADIPGTKSSSKRASSDSTFARVRLAGLIAAGSPMTVPEDTDHYVNEDNLIDIPPYLLGGNDPDEVFALRVRGDSMIDAMIGNDDLVIIKPQSTATNGEMVAVWLPKNGETTLKYYFPEGDKVRLQPAHPTMEPIYVDASNCEIKGRVLSVIRQLQ